MSYGESGEGNGNPLQYSRLENSMNRGSWRARVQRVAKSCTLLKQLSTPEYSLEGLMLKLKLQYFGHLMQRIDRHSKQTREFLLSQLWGAQACEITGQVHTFKPNDGEVHLI